MSVIELVDVSVTFDSHKLRTPVLKHINLGIAEGSTVAIVGRSGSGKSTLMNIMGLLFTAFDGRFSLNGDDIGHMDATKRARARGENLGFVFQNYHLLPRLTALENICLPLTYVRSAAMSRSKAFDQAERCLDRVGLCQKGGQYPAELSGGEQQRVAIARALINDPAIILADEPTGALDTGNGNKIVSILKTMSVRDGRTVVIVTHDQRIADQCTRCVHLADGALLRDVLSE